MKRIYLDYAATTPLDIDILKKMEPYFYKFYGNAAAVSEFSKEAKIAIDEARENIAAALNCKREEIFFTSGGTESDNWALIGTAIAKREKGNHIITSAIEHPAIINTCKYLEKLGFKITYVPVDKYGIVNLEYLKKAITNKTILVSIMFANNEIGTIQPIEEIGNICENNNITFHTDAVQAIGSVKIDVQKMKIQMLSMSAHKFYGPKGIGILYIKKGVKIDPYLHGGEQERGKRAGTENTSAIIGIGEAIKMVYLNIDKESLRLKKLRDKFISEVLKISGTALNGSSTLRLPGNVNICFKGVEAETLLMALDLRGISASAGSACSAGSLEPSHVLLALGLSKEEAKSSIRFTFGKHTTDEDIEKTIEVLKEIVESIR